MLFVYGRILNQRLANTITSKKFFYHLVSGFIKYHMVTCYFLYEVEIRVKNMEEELQNNLEERNGQLQASASAAENLFSWRFDVRELSEDSPDDFEGLDASVAHIVNFLSTEPADIKLGIGGFSIGVATALYSATCFAQGKYGNGIDYPVNLRAIVGLSGWLPGSSFMHDVEEQDRRITGGCKGMKS
ncbi:unnamed protein product [Camellia sinensis]